MTILKIIGIVLIVGGVFFYSRGATFSHFAAPPVCMAGVGCLLSELQCLRRCVLTTDGTKCLWSQVRSNGRNAIFLVRVVIGMVIVVVAYLLTNLS